MSKRKLIQGLLLSMIICLCGCSNTTQIASFETDEESSITTTDISLAENEEIEQTEEKSEIEVTDYEYPDEFELEEGLRGAIEQLAIWYGKDFEAKEAVQEDTWQEFVIATYIQGNWDGYEYLKKLESGQDGIVTKEQLEYIQYSLTGIEVDFKGIGENDTINCLENIGSSYYGHINDYFVQCDGDKVSMSAEFETSASNGSNKRMYDMTVLLQKNPKSCFDGYSIISLSKEDVTVAEAGDGIEHSFIGGDMDFEAKDGTLTFELDSSDDDVEYSAIIHVSASDEQKKYVKENAGSLFKVTYVFSENMQQPVERVEAISIEIMSN